MYLKINCNLEFLDVALRLAPDVTPGSFEHDSENVYEWMWVNIQDIPFSLNVSREHGWANIDDGVESIASVEELKARAIPGPVYIFGWDRSTDSCVDRLPKWLPQFVADRLSADVLVYNGRVNVDLPDREPVALVQPRHENRK